MNESKYLDFFGMAGVRSTRQLSEKARAYLTAVEARRSGLTEEQRALFEGDSQKTPLAGELAAALQAGSAPSAFFRSAANWACGTCVLQRHWDAFLWAVDACTERLYPQGWLRRPFRSDRYTDYYGLILDIAERFSLRAIVDADLCDVLSGRLSPEALACTRECSHGYCEELIAWEVNRGNERLISLLTACLNGDEGAPQANRSIFLAIQLSGCEALHAQLGKLLLAARLQEGLRQSICETADEGTIPAFRHILGVIAENGLIRFSSVRRAVNVWTGLGAEDPKDLERITDKTLSLVLNGLDGGERRAAMLQSEDSMEIYAGLWAEAVENCRNAEARAENLILHGTRRQAAVCCFFASVMQNQEAYLRLAGQALARFPEDQEILALCLQAFLTAAGYGMIEGDRIKTERTLKAADAQWYPLLRAWHQRLRSGELTVQTDVFPWLKPVVRRENLALALCALAAVSGEERLQDDALTLLPQVNTDYGFRVACMKALLTPVSRPAQKESLMAALADKSADSRKAAFQIADSLPPGQLDFAVIEGHLRLKQGDLRANCLRLLIKQDDGALTESVKRLLADPLPQKRAAGYDLILQIAASPERAQLKARCADLLPPSAPQDPQEKLLWESASGAVKAEEGQKRRTDGLFDEGDRYEPDLSPVENDPACQEAYAQLFPDSWIAGAEKTSGRAEDCPSCAQARGDLDALYALIGAHKGEPFGKTRPDSAEKLVGFDRIMPPEWYASRGEDFPCAGLWESWYESLGGPERLFRAFVLLQPPGSFERKNSDFAADFAAALFGAGFQRLTFSPYAADAGSVCAWLIDRHGGTEGILCSGMRAAIWLIREAPSELFAWADRSLTIEDGEVKERVGVESILQQRRTALLLYRLFHVDRAVWPTVFALREGLRLRYAREAERIMAGQDGAERSAPQLNAGAGIRLFPDVLDDLRAVRMGLFTERTLISRLFEGGNLRAGIGQLSRVSLWVRAREGETGGMPGRGWSRRRTAWKCLETVRELTGRQEDFTDEDLALMADADRICLKVMPVILEAELSRGDSPAEWSWAVPGIQYVRGVEWLGRILAALGKAPLRRSTWMLAYQTKPGRTDSLCHLLSVCVPAAGDGAAALGETVTRYRVTERRLTELAMYNTAWAPLIGGYLQWPGFVSAVHFFIAHMNETLDDERKALIARFTPLTPDELSAGAFDVDWFRQVWEEAGASRFALLYDAAKYLTDSARHTRARKYADAALGRLKTEETEKTILEKRGKDLLMAYALIPLADEQDLLRRFLFIQRYLKDSRRFGAQRAASERRAAEMALVNLAACSGDRDVIRLTLRMEGQLADGSLNCFEPVSVEDVTARLVCGPADGVRLLCEKDGKELKTVPARLKKHPEILRLTESKKQLTEQARRCRSFLEEAMTDGIRLSGEEIQALRRNQVIRPMVDSLVMKTETEFGLPSGGGLIRADGSVIPWAGCASVQVAHPYHLYEAGVWHAWQERVFSGRIAQPFKQVFRELYVRTEDEEGREESLRYAGHQIQPRKAAAVLRARRWTASAEDGLQRVFYREGLVAVLLARADWFTPSDVEAPTLESIRFFERRNGRPVRLDQVPALVFSETMRDVDLAVSVAFVGGVDPEASHSTIEMRAALLSFVLPMFGIRNVRVERSHAVIEGKLSSYSVHLGSGVVHQQGGAMLLITAVPSQHRGRLFLPFVEDDPQTAEILTKVLFLAEDHRIRDPGILEQIR